MVCKLGPPHRGIGSKCFFLHFSIACTAHPKTHRLFHKRARDTHCRRKSSASTPTTQTHNQYNVIRKNIQTQPSGGVGDIRIPIACACECSCARVCVCVCANQFNCAPMNILQNPNIRTKGMKIEENRNEYLCPINGILIDVQLCETFCQ